MTDRAMRVALVAIREIAEDPRILAIVDEALEGRPVREPTPGPGPSGPLSPAERMRRYRERRNGAPVTRSDAPVTPEVTAVTSRVTGPVTANVTAAAPPDPPENLPFFSDLVPSERGSETRVRVTNVTAVTSPVTTSVTSRVTNATADGAGGLAVSAWAEGIRSATKKPFMPPRGGSAELAKLVDALIFFCPDAATRVEWARAEGKRFADTARGKLSAHTFVDWLNPTGGEGAAKAAPLVEGPAVLEERARREAARAEAEKNRAAPPAAAFEAFGVKPKKGAA